MARCVVDLHNHTPLVPSDYRGPTHTSALDLIGAAAACGIDLLAVTDHSSVAYVEQVIEAAAIHSEVAGRRVAVVPGAEIKVRWGVDETHLIALFAPTSVRESFAALSAAIGLPNGDTSADDLPGIIVHAHPCDVAREIDALGGICHIAHADRLFGEYRFLGRPLFDELAGCGCVSAVELVDPANAEAVARRAPGLAVIASSDSHSPEEIGRRTCVLELDEPSFDGLIRAYRSNRRPSISRG